MTHISKKELDKKHLNHLFVQLIKILGAANNSNFNFSDQFFTKSEKIMLSKRLAAIQMLSKGFPVYTISEALYMSPSTINLMSIRYEEGKYEHIVKNSAKNSGFLDLIDLILSGGGIMPPLTGKRKR